MRPADSDSTDSTASGGTPPDSDHLEAAGARPPTAEEETGLRRAVGELAAVSSRRPMVSLVRVGRPGGISCDFVVSRPTSLDAALRADVVGALLREASRQLPAPVLWLARAGSLTTEDADLAWHAAARTAYAEAGVPLLMAVVTRYGWYEPATGRRRQWKRLRLQR